MVLSMSIACSIFMLLAYTGIQSSPAAAESPAFIRIVHASPDVGTVDVFMDGMKLLSSFQYASVTNYLPLPAGSHNMKIALIGKGVNASVITQTFPVSIGKAYTIAALGMQSTKNLSVKVFEDDNTVAGNTSKVRVYHLSPGAGSVDTAESMHTVIHGISYSQASDYILVPAGSHVFDMTISPANVAIPVSTALKPWTVTSLFAIGLLNSSPALKFVTAQAPGVPGLPQTGSSPIAESSQPWTFLAIALCLLLTVAGSIYRRERSA